MDYKLGSLFDGSGGFPLAGALCGIEPCWAAEVEPYPIAVTRSRFDGEAVTPLRMVLQHNFPNMKLLLHHLGDVSKVHGGEVEPVDIVTFGSPCQDLSVAGKRAGLKHEANGDEETTRSGLFMEAVRIIKEMRAATNGEYPTFALWENVPGAFSSNKGEDFRTVLEELIRIVEPHAVMPDVPRAGWAHADSYTGNGWSLAYRVFDAQYWGVPQRRRRIYLVVDFRGERAREVLFEREGVRGYFAQGRTPWQDLAGDAQNGAGADDSTRESAGDGIAVVEPIKCYDIGEARLRTPSEYTEKSPTLTARCGTGGNNVPAVVYDARGNGDGEVVSTLTGDHENRITDYSAVVVENQPVYCLQGNGIDRADTAGCNGKGWKQDTAYTLNTIDRHATAYTMQGFGDYKNCEVASGLKARDYKDATDLVAQPVAIDRAFFNQGQNAQYDPQYYTDGTAPTLVARGPSAVAVKYIVRRLTPTECARLQGFPDWWGHIEEKTSFSESECAFWKDVRNTHAAINGKQTKDYTEAQMLSWYNKLHTDSAEYKMWGNGIALPTALYCMQGIAEQIRRKA